MPESVVSFDVEQVQKSRTAGSRMNANREIEIICGFVNWKEIRIIQRPISFDAAKKDADRPIVFGPLQFFDRFVDGFERWNRGPSHTAPGFSARLCEKTIVGAAQSHIQNGIIRKINQEKRWKDHLGFHAEFVHVFEPAGDVGHFPVSQMNISPGGFQFGCRRSNETKTTYAVGLRENIAVDQPEGVSRTVESVFGAF